MSLIPSLTSTGILKEEHIFFIIFLFMLFLLKAPYKSTTCKRCPPFAFQSLVIKTGSFEGIYAT
jgi:hypothetical protein